MAARRMAARRMAPRFARGQRESHRQQESPRRNEQKGRWDWGLPWTPSSSSHNARSHNRCQRLHRLAAAPPPAPRRPRTARARARRESPAYPAGVGRGDSPRRRPARRRTRAGAGGHRGGLLPDPLDGEPVTGSSTESAGAPTRLSFPERERRAAENFTAAARRAGVTRVVYLGGPRPQVQERGFSPHLASRLEVERILLEGIPGSVALRAAIVIGAQSRSFRFMVRLVERMPVLTLPSWRRLSLTADRRARRD